MFINQIRYRLSPTKDHLDKPGVFGLKREDREYSKWTNCSPFSR